MKMFTKIFLALLLGAGLAQAAAFSKDAKFRNATAHITAEKPLTKGSNVLVVKLKKSGKIITDAQVILKSFMPAMPGMPAMSSKVKAKNLGNGEYEGKLNLPMSGTWQLHILITPKQGKRSRIKTILNI